MAFGAESEMELYYGADEGDDAEVKAGSPGAIVAEALSNIRTVASLTLEDERAKSFHSALENESKSPIVSIVKKGQYKMLTRFYQLIPASRRNRWLGSVRVSDDLPLPLHKD